MGLLSIGRVKRAHGIHGALEVFLYSKALDGFRDLNNVLLTRPGKWAGEETTRFEIKRAREKQKGLVILELNGVLDRTTAEQLKGCEVLCETCDLPPLEEDEFYWFEIEGFEVVDINGHRLGVVTGCLETPGHDLIVCEGNKGEFLVPVVAEILKEIRRPQGQIVIAPPPGLMEVNAL